jgi:iron complex outermembrane receptor protein
LFVRNLLDERIIIAQSFGNPTTAPSLTFSANNPRTFGATLRIKLY